MVALTVRIVVLVLAIEGIGAVLLMTRMIPSTACARGLALGLPLDFGVLQRGIRPGGRIFLL